MVVMEATVVDTTEVTMEVMVVMEVMEDTEDTEDTTIILTTTEDGIIAGTEKLFLLTV